MSFILSFVAMTKSERRRNTARRVREAANARRDKMRTVAAIPAAAWASQTYGLGKMPTPGFATLPLTLSLGGAAMLYDFLYNPSGLAGAVGDVGIGLVAGQLGADAAKKAGG